MFVKHQEAELSEDEVGRILQGSKIKTQVKVCKFKDFQNVFVRSLLCSNMLVHIYLITNTVKE